MGVRGERGVGDVREVAGEVYEFEKCAGGDVGWVCWGV